MKRLKGFGTVVVLGLVCVASLAGQGGNQPLVFRKHVLMDQDGFQMEVLRLLAPKDWQFRGGVKWDCGQLFYFLDGEHLRDRAGNRLDPILV